MRSALSRIGMAAVVAAGLLSSLPGPVAAADGYTETADTTYVLDPVKDQLHVTVTIKIKNTTRSTAEQYTCWKDRWDPWLGWVPYLSTCTRTTNYYLYSTQAVVEDGAIGLKVTSGSSTLKAKLGPAKWGYRVAAVTYPRLYYGQTRTVTVTYSVSSGKPRSTSELRLTQAYAHFCVLASGVDSATVTVKLPQTYTVDVTGSSLGSTLHDGTLIYTSGTISNPSAFYTCLDGLNEKGYKSETLTGPDGLTLNLRSWPEDPEWLAAVSKDALAGVGALAALIGEPMPVKGALTIEEAVTGNEYAGFYDRLTNKVTVDESYQQPSLVEHELAHTWFNMSVFGETWMSEGSAEWAGRTVSKDEPPCTAPATAGGAKVNLGSWLRLNPRSTDAERTALETQYTTACYVVTALVAAAGSDGAQRALLGLLNQQDPYAADPTTKRATTTATWKDWLDAWDQLGLTSATGADATAANATLATNLVVKYGITSDRGLLDKRAAARLAYQSLAAQVGDWVVPVAIRKPMSAWDFAAAQAAITAAGPAWDLTGQTDAALAGVDARRGPAAKAWAAATTAAELTAAADLAQQQLDAAKAVAAAGVVAGAPLDTLQQVGLLGATVPTLDSATAAVRNGDAAKAKTDAASVVTFLDGLRGTGQTRVTVAVGVGVGLLLLLMVLLLVGRRRRSSARAAAAMSPEPPEPPAPPAPPAPPSDNAW